MSQTRIIMNTVSTLDWLIWIDFVLHSVWRTESQHCALCIDIYYQHLIEYDQFIYFSFHSTQSEFLFFNAKIMFIFCTEMIKKLSVIYVNKKKSLVVKNFILLNNAWIHGNFNNVYQFFHRIMFRSTWKWWNFNINHFVCVYIRCSIIQMSINMMIDFASIATSLDRLLNIRKIDSIKCELILLGNF